MVLSNRFFILAALLSASALADVIPLTSLSLVQSAPGTTSLIDGNTVLRLTPNFETNPGSPVSPAGAAWTSTTQDVADPFSLQFHFRMSDPCLAGLPTCVDDHGHGGDGIAFVIQNSAQGNSAIGVGAGGMGFLGITDSVAIMLDTYQNIDPNFYGDPSNNYIAVNTRGTLFNAPHHFCTNGQLTADPALPSDLTGSSFSPDCTTSPTLGMTGFGGVNPLSVNMDDGQVHALGVVYTGSVLDVYLDSALALSVSLDLASALDLQNGTGAFLGFTAGTRFAYQNQDILDFTIAPEPAWGQIGLPLAMLLAALMARKFQRRKA